MKWREVLSEPFLRRYVGWAIHAGILPARIAANLRGANLSGALYCRHTICGRMISILRHAARF